MILIIVMIENKDTRSVNHKRHIHVISVISIHLCVIGTVKQPHVKRLALLTSAGKSTNYSTYQPVMTSLSSVIITGVF